MMADSREPVKSKKAWDYTNDIIYMDVITRRRAQEVYTSHRKRMKESQCLVDCNLPSTYNLLGRNSHRDCLDKRHQIIQDRLMQIFLENTRLVNKMAQIIVRRCHRPRTTFTLTSHVLRPSLSRGDALYCKKSLNESARKKENVKICKENKHMKERENALKSEYCRDKMIKFAKEKQKHADNVSKTLNRHRNINGNFNGRQSNCCSTYLNQEEKPIKMNVFVNGYDSGPCKTPKFNRVVTPSNVYTNDDATELSKFTIKKYNGEGLSLRTARQIRSDVALHRGQRIPDIVIHEYTNHFTSALLSTDRVIE